MPHRFWYIGPVPQIPRQFPDGGLKDMMARVTMLAMHRDGLIALPAPRGRQNRPGPIVFGPDTEAPLFPAPTTLDKVRPLDLRPVVRGTRESKLWNEFVARYHYLGYKTLVGAQMRYAVHDRNGWPLAMLGFSTAAWKLAPRDTFIGWTRQLREKNLPFVVDNPRFLILPWIKIRGHCAYYGLTGNGKRLEWFRYQVVRIWRTWLARRSRLRRLNWDRMNEVLKRYPLPSVTFMRSWQNS